MLSDLAVGCPNTGLLISTILMDNNRCTKILFWNVRGINTQTKWDAIRDKKKQKVPVYRRPKGKTLILSTSKSFALET